MSNAAVLEISGLDIALAGAAGDMQLVDGVSFAIPRGEAFGLVGESGCGKSITALAVMGLLRAPLRRSAGRILLDGRDIATASEAEMRELRGRHHDFPGTDDCAQSAAADRAADCRDVRAASGYVVEAG